MKSARILLPIILIASQTALATGSGVGSGTDGEREVTMNEMLTQLVQDLPSLSGNQFYSQDVLSQWCNRVIPVLNQARETSIEQRDQGEYAFAYQVLVDALSVTNNSLQSAPAGQLVLPYTRKLVAQVLSMARALEQESRDIADLQTRRDLIDTYIVFIISQIRNWDVQIYLPYQFNHHYQVCSGEYCPPSFDVMNYDRQLLQVASDTLGYLHGSLVHVVNRSVRPTGSPLSATRTYLKAAEILTGLLARDLQPNLFAAQNACVIAELGNLSDMLTAYNAGTNPFLFRTPATALRRTYLTIESLRSQLTRNSQIPQCGR